MQLESVFFNILMVCNYLKYFYFNLNKILLSIINSASNKQSQ